MDTFGVEDVIAEGRMLADLEDCVKRFSGFRWNHDKTKKILSPHLSSIARSSDFQALLLLCSEHSPSTMTSILGKALKKCTDSREESTRKEKRKNGDAEVQAQRNNSKRAKLLHVGQTVDCCNLQRKSSAQNPHASRGMNRIGTPIRPTRYEIERGLVCEKEEIQKLVSTKCWPLSPDYGDNNWLNKTDELQALFRICGQLKLHRVKEALVNELEDRLVLPGHLRFIPPIATTVGPLSGLRVIRGSNLHINSNVHHVYDLMKSYRAVQQLIAYRYRRHPTSLISAHEIVLSEHAHLAAGNASQKKEAIEFGALMRDYNIGEKWSNIAKSFGGSGIVLVLVVAEIGNSVVDNWTGFQCSCLEVISEYFPILRGLVGLLGPDALEDYCRYGHLAKEEIEAVMAYPNED